MRAVAVVLLALALFGCGPKPTLQADWPRADSERTFERPQDQAVWPLTGKVSSDASAAASPAVVLPVASDPPGLPVPGLESADVVYATGFGTGEHLVAVFHSALPAAAGPLGPVLPLDSALAAAYGTRLLARPSDDTPLVDVAALASRPASGSAAPPALSFQQSTPRPVAATAVSSLTVPMAGGKVEWRYDAKKDRYLRFVSGKPQTSAREQISATNVVVLWAPSADPSVRPLSGQGRASVLIGGNKIVGSWEASAGPPVLTDSSGAPVLLAPGNTWVQVIPSATNVIVR
jgi:hypothetical protein